MPRLVWKIQRTIILWACYSYESKRFNLSGACFIFREVSRRVNLSHLLLINNYLSSRDHCWWSMIHTLEPNELFWTKSFSIKHMKNHVQFSLLHLNVLQRITVNIGPFICLGKACLSLLSKFNSCKQYNLCILASAQLLKCRLNFIPFVDRIWDHERQDFHL